MDSRHADQQVRGAIVLPHGTGKTVRVLVFAKGGQGRRGRSAAGADYVGAEDMVAQASSGENWLDFDVVIATPDMMGVVGRLGKSAGPQGPDAQPQGRHRHHGCGKGHHRMPRPVRSSTAWTRPTSSTARMGKVSFGTEKLTENFNALLGAIIKAKPAAAKGQYIRSCVVAATMGPGVKINQARLTD